MQILSIIFLRKGEPAPWADEKNPVIAEEHGALICLDEGMSSGAPSVALKIKVLGQTIIWQTSAKLFCLQARAIEARYPDLFKG